MSHHKRSRVGRLPRWQRLASHGIFLICALSGLAFFLKRQMGMALWEIAARDFLVLHGISAAFSLLVFGSVLPNHVRAAWNVQRNRLTGILMLVVMALLMASGLGLYYGSEDMHDTMLWSHWIIGFLLFAVLPLHLVVGARAPLHGDKAAITEARTTTHPAAVQLG